MAQLVHSDDPKTGGPYLRVSRESTQPPAEALVSHAELVRRLRLLSRNPRVHVFDIGRSVQGRVIQMIAITDERSASNLDEVRKLAGRLAAPTVRHDTPVDLTVLESLEAISDRARVPVLIQSSDFGFEASQVESLLALAEELATSNDPDVIDVLDRLLVLIVPLINPDGREAAIHEWRTKPLSSGASGEGNFYGVGITREYLAISQPETAALTEVLAWHPFLHWDVHEDAVALGWHFPQTCFGPPIGPKPHLNGSTSAGPDENDPRVYEIEGDFGVAIAAAWEEAGFDYLFDIDGEHGWPSAIFNKDPVKVYAPETRLTRALLLRGVSAWITESCRLPGVQSWEDRNRQKIVAGKAILRTAAARRADLVEIAADVSRRAIAEGLKTKSYYIIPTAQDPALVAWAAEILGRQGIATYAARNDEALVVPRSQPLGPTVDILMSLEKGLHQSIPARLGLRVIPSWALPAEEQRGWEREQLVPGGKVFSGSVARRPPQPDSVRIANSDHAVTAIARLLQVPGARVHWDAKRTGATGDFAISISGPQAFEQWATDLSLEYRDDAQLDTSAWPTLRLPRVGVYGGQGVRHVAHEGYLGRYLWLLRRWGLPFTILDASMLSDETFSQIDVLVVPGGDASQILNGWDPEDRWNRYPWDPPEPRVGIAEAGIAAIETYIRGGGAYIGIDTGGGWLASREHLGLADVSVATSSLGSALVTLSSVDEHPLFAGMSGSWSDHGDWRPGQLHAYYSSYPQFGVKGGTAFSVGPNANALAVYTSARPVPGVPHFKDGEELIREGDNVAVAEAQLGSGTMLLFGFDPTYRCVWHSTFRLISNAIFMAVSDGV